MTKTVISKERVNHICLAGEQIIAGDGTGTSHTGFQPDYRELNGG
jgi:hypothetical protein